MYKLGLNFEHVPVSALEQGVSVVETLKKFKMYGVKSVDILFSRLLSNENNVKQDLLTAGINADCVFFKGDFGHDANIGYALSVVDYCAENGIKQIMLLTNELTETDDKKAYDSLLKRNLRRLVKYANNFGVLVGIENFGKENSPFSTLNKVLDVLKSVKGLGLVYDSGNFLLAGEDPLTCVKTLMPYIQRVHIKDRTYKEIEGSPMQVSIDGKNTYTTELGNGDSKIKEVILEVKKYYDNIDFTLEFDFAKPNITSDVINSATYFCTEV